MALTSLPNELRFLIGTYLAPPDLANYLLVLTTAGLAAPAWASFVRTVTKPVIAGPDSVTAAAFSITIAREVDNYKYYGQYKAIPDFYDLPGSSGVPTSLLRQLDSMADYATAELVNGVLHGPIKFYRCHGHSHGHGVSQVCPHSQLCGRGYYRNGLKSGAWVLTGRVNWFDRIENCHVQTYHRESGHYDAISGDRSGAWLIEQVVIETLPDQTVVARWYKTAHIEMQQNHKEGSAEIAIEWLVIDPMTPPRARQQHWHQIEAQGQFQADHPVGQWQLVESDCQQIVKANGKVKQISQVYPFKRDRWYSQQGLIIKQVNEWGEDELDLSQPESVEAEPEDPVMDIGMLTADQAVINLDGEMITGFMAALGYTAWSN